MGAERPPYCEAGMTATNTVAVQVVSTITVAASGDPGSTATFYPARSNAPFTMLGVSIVPIDAAAYKVEMFHDGELEETHTFPTATNKYVCHMVFPNIIFPANVGTNAIPKYFGNSRKDFPGIPIAVKVYNYTSTRETFLVYCTFEEYDHCRFAELTTIDIK